jgi:hypothetical protein
MMSTATTLFDLESVVFIEYSEMNPAHRADMMKE